MDNINATNHYKIVLPSDLNDYGSLFGGCMLQWIDEIGYIAVSLDFPGRHFVTIGLDNVEFKHRISEGQILKFVCERTRKGNTSVTYHVSVFGVRYHHERGDETVFETSITFVCVDADGNKTKIVDDVVC